MANQQIIFTALPIGVRDGNLHLSVFVSPRLRPAAGDEATLEPFPDWHDWPAQDIAFGVSVAGGPVIDAEPVGGDRDSSLWTGLFDGDTPVTRPPGAAALPSHRTWVRSWPVKTFHDFAKTQYASIGATFATTRPRALNYLTRRPASTGTSTGGTFDGGGTSDGVPSRIGPITLAAFRLRGARKEAAIAAIRDKIAADGYFTGGTLPGTDGEPDFEPAEIALLLAEQFHFRRSENNPSPPPVIKVALLAEDDDVPDLDFHAALAALGEYPALMRKLGLVRDVRIPMPDPIPASPVTVAVSTAWDGAIDTEPIFPLTQTEITAERFVLHATSDLIERGLLLLDHPDFALVDIDPDAAADKTLNFIDTVLDAGASDGADLDSDQAPPALTGAGLALTHAGRAPELQGKVEHAKTMDGDLDPGDPPVLSAEDVTSGLRVDVWDDATESWHSLCRRRGTYEIAGSTVEEADEGAVVTGHSEQDGDDTLYLHDSIIRWLGWSVVAPRPGRGPASDGTLVEADSDPDPDRFDLKASFTAEPGSLPKLRYGRTYRMRARTADLAGNGLVIGDVDGFDAATNEVTYRRTDPVAAPYVLLRKPATEGESPEVAVIRGNYDDPADETTERHVAPQRIGQHTAEQHGTFDVEPSPDNPGGVDKAAYALIVEREAGRLGDLGEPDPGSHNTPFYDTDTLELPFLPDIFARGAAFRGMPGADEVVTVDFDLGQGGWPDARPFRLRLAHGSGAPEWDASARVLTARLGPGRVAAIQYSCRIDDADRDQLTSWSWLMEYIADGGGLPDDLDIPALEQLARDGQLWQLTPYRTLTLVHAVRQPLLPPHFAKPVAVRLQDETFARIVDKLTLDAQSTSKVDVEAEWTEPVDNVRELEPGEATGRARAFDVVLDHGSDDGDVLPIDHRHEFHDTKYRQVRYTAVASTRFGEYYITRVVHTLVQDDPVAIAASGIAPGTDVVRSLGTEQERETYRRGVDYAIDYADGTVTALNDTLDGAEVEIAYVPAPITRHSTEDQPAAVIDVRSSARPAAPEIAHIVPTFGWEQSEEGGELTRVRRGNGLRIFLKRPWYSSGAGEQLGVVVFNAALPSGETERVALVDRLERYVTMWGEDPAFSSEALDQPPLLDDFPLAVRPKSDQLLAEIDERVGVAPHDVAFDAERGLWFADVAVEPTDTYQPFVRLALARYQPMSLADVELSPTVLAQFVQLTPDRSLSVVPDSDDPRRLDVTLSGLTYTPLDGFAQPAEVDILVQVQRDGLSGDLGWVTDTAATLAATATLGTWSGPVTLPSDQGSRPMRLVVEEYEAPSDPSETGNRKLVYTDAVEI